VYAGVSVLSGSDGIVVDAGAAANGGGGVWALTSTVNPALTILDLSRSVISANGFEGVVVVGRGGGAVFMQALLSDNVVADHSGAQIELGMISAAAGGVRAVVTNNRVRGGSGSYGIYINRANVTAVMSGNVVSHTHTGVRIDNAAVVRSRGDNVVDDNTTNEFGSAVAANLM